MKKLNVLFILGKFPVVSQTFIINQIIDLINNGHNVCIYSTSKGHKYIQDRVIQYKLLESTVFVENPKTTTKRVLNLFSFLLRTRNFRIFNSLNFFKYKRAALTLNLFGKISAFENIKGDFDIAHIHFGYNYKLFTLAQKCGYLSFTKPIVTFHGFDMDVKDLAYNKQYYKELFEKNILLTTNNEYAKQQILKIHSGYKNIKILPVGLDTEYFTPKKVYKLDNKFNVLFCGRLIEWKGALELIEIANEIINKRFYSNVCFHIIGDGAEKNQVKELIAKYKLAEYVKLYGARIQKEIFNTMEKMDVFISPGKTVRGRAETQGLVIQEAQAMELPVIVTTAGGMKYGVLDNVTGFVIEERNIQEMTNKLEFFINNPEIRKEMAKASRRYVVDNFDSRFLGDKLLNIYKEVIKN